MRAVLISIAPKWSEKIANGIKTVEVRKTVPKLQTPFKGYIYCTIPRKKEDVQFYTIQFGTVIGEFVCDKLIRVLDHPSIFAGHPLFYRQAIDDACLTDEEIEVYSCGKDVYGWHISDLVLYDKPKELREFYNYDTTYNNAFGWAFSEEEKRVYLKRPPRSWCYVEEVHNGTVC